MGASASVVGVNETKAGNAAFASGDADLATAAAEIHRLRAVVKTYVAAAEELLRQSSERWETASDAGGNVGSWGFASGDMGSSTSVDPSTSACVEVVALRCAIEARLATMALDLPPAAAAPAAAAPAAAAAETVVEDDDTLTALPTEQWDMDHHLGRIRRASIAPKRMKQKSDRDYLAYRLHDKWRQQRPRTPGGSRPLPHLIEVDGQEFDVAALDMDDLPIKFARTYDAVAGAAFNCIEDQLDNAEEMHLIWSDGFIRASSEELHKVWMERNRTWGNPALLVPFRDLPRARQAKLTEMMHEGRRVWQRYNPALAAALHLVPEIPSGRRHQSVLLVAEKIKEILRAMDDTSTVAT